MLWLLLLMLVLGGVLAYFSASVRVAVGWVALGLGLAVFAVRFQHAGPYVLPERGNLLAAILTLAIAFAMTTSLLADLRWAEGLRRAILVFTPVIIFFSVYAVLAELEEVVVLRGTLPTGTERPLRLWIMDDDDGTWVTMSREKAEANGLIDGPAELLRHGESFCVFASLERDPATLERVFALGVEKYRVKRFAMAIGLFASTPSPDSVSLRLEGCDDHGRPG